MILKAQEAGVDEAGEMTLDQIKIAPVEHGAILQASVLPHIDN